MKIVDANVLLYSVNRQSGEHKTARASVATFDRDFGRFGIRVHQPS